MNDAYSTQEILATCSQQTQARMTYENCVIFSNPFLLRLKADLNNNKKLKLKKKGRLNSTLKAGQVATLFHNQV